MSGAQNGHVRAAAHDPVPEMQLGALELPDGEREAALEALNATLARRDPRRPALAGPTAQLIHTVWLRAWRESYVHGLRVRAAERRAAMEWPR